MPKPFKPTFIDQDKKINLEEGIIPFILTSKTVDRDSEVILPDGGDVTEFKTNPVFLWAHDMWSPSIGKVLPETIKATKTKMTADVKFDLDDPFAALIFNKYAKGFLNAGSIRFRPTEIGTEPVLPMQKGATIKKWKLLEFSAVPVPANPEALAQITAKGFGIKDEKADKWHEVLKSFYDESEGHLPEDFIDYLNDKADDEELETAASTSYIEPRYDLVPAPAGPEELKTQMAEIMRVMTNIHVINSKLQVEMLQITGKNAIPFEFNLPFAYKNWVTGDERFIHHGDDGKPDWKAVARCMIELFKDDTLKGQERLEVYYHLARHYKEFDHEPPPFTDMPFEIEPEEIDDGKISDADMQRIVDLSVQKLQKQ